LANEVHPALFDDCGMVLVAERGCVDCGDDTIVPSRQWHNCPDSSVSLANIKLQLAFGWGLGKTIFDSWTIAPGDVEFDEDADGSSCWDTSTTTLEQAGLDGYFAAAGGMADPTTTLEAFGVIGCVHGVDPLNSPMNDYSCGSPYKFLNDNSGGKPPYYDGSYFDFMVVLQDCGTEDGSTAVGCDEADTGVCFTGGVSQTGVGVMSVLLPVALTLSFVRSIFGQQ